MPATSRTNISPKAPVSQGANLPPRPFPSEINRPAFRGVVEVGECHVPRSLAVSGVRQVINGEVDHLHKQYT